MSQSITTLCKTLEQRFAEALIETKTQCQQITLVIAPQSLLEVCLSLRDEFDFAQLIDLSGVDYSSYGVSDWATHETTSTGFSRARCSSPTIPIEQRFAVVYHLLSLDRNCRLRLRCYLAGEPPRLPSVCEIWNSADWYEREAFDLYGILFDNHPDLRRILTDYGFIGYPFRKDFPLEGHVEVRYDPDKKRVIYQPVTIKNRVLVPRVIRQDNRYTKPIEGSESREQ